MNPGPSRRSPHVLMPACHRQLHGFAHQVLDGKYAQAVRLAGCLPVVVPVARRDELPELLDMADGILLTGSSSNVHPSHFGEAVLDASLPLDPGRDDWTLPLVPEALARGLPLFAICRGLQEANVALGGSLHQAVHAQPGMQDHRAPDTDVLEREFGLAHPVKVQAGGILESLLGPIEFDVNSLHGQGIARLAPGLRVEATAPDGLIEAFSEPRAPAFNLCVQWHPEWEAQRNPVSTRLFDAFGHACRAYLRRRQRHS